MLGHRQIYFEIWVCFLLILLAKIQFSDMYYVKEQSHSMKLQKNQEK